MDFSFFDSENVLDGYRKEDQESHASVSVESDEEANIAKTPWLFFGGWQKVILLVWLIIGLLAVAAVFSTVYIKSLAVRQSRLEHKCDSWATGLEKSFKESRNHISSYKAILNVWNYGQTVNQMSQEKFLEYSRLTKETRPLVIGVAYLDRVLNESRATFEAKQKWQILDYFLGRQIDKAEYAPVMYSDLSFPLISRVDAWAGENSILSLQTHIVTFAKSVKFCGFQLQLWRIPYIGL